MTQGTPSAHAKLASSGVGSHTLQLDSTAMAALVSEPRFDAAMLVSATAVVDLYRGHWALNRLVSDRGRFSSRC